MFCVATRISRNILQFYDSDDWMRKGSSLFGSCNFFFRAENYIFFNSNTVQQPLTQCLFKLSNLFLCNEAAFSSDYSRHDKKLELHFFSFLHGFISFWLQEYILFILPHAILTAICIQ